MSLPDVPRVVLDGVLKAEECAELIFIVRLLNVVGYRAGVSSATIFEVAASELAFIVPLMVAREKVRAAVEEALDLSVLVEFTGLISWRTSAEIAFHFDSNRPYLTQREYSAVCYLNTAGADFQGGAFRFQEGSPSHVLPAPGRVVAYHARDVHGVDAVVQGERFTLTLWFTTNPEHNEDPKLMARLPGRYQPATGLPPSMYTLPGAFDLRLCRLAMMGLALARQGVPVLGPYGAGIEGTGPVQLVVNLARLARWRGRSAQACSAGETAAGTAGMCGGVSQGREVPRDSGEANEGERGGRPKHARQAGGGSQPGITLTVQEFPSLERAVSVLQFWAWRQHPERWAREDVCSRHLQGDAGPHNSGAAADCSWAAEEVAAVPSARVRPAQLQADGGVQEQQRQARAVTGAVAADAAPKMKGGGGMSFGQGQVSALCAEVHDSSVALDAYMAGLQQQYNSVVHQWHELGAIF